MPDIVKSIVSAAVKRMGFYPSGSSSWQRSLSEVTHVIALPRSRWGGESYIQLGVWLKVFGPDESPRYNQTHVQLRLTSDCGLELGRIDDALRDDDLWKMDPVDRSAIINEALNRAEVAFFSNTRSLKGLHRLLVREHGLRLAVNRVVKDYFGIPID